jgi:AraC-like DNA-binding protein
MKVIEPGVLPSSDVYSHIPTEYAKNNLHAIYFAGTYDCTAPYMIERDNHDYFIIIHIKKGTLLLELSDANYTACAGDFLFFDCRLPQKYYTPETVSFDFIHFKGLNSQTLFNEVKQKGPLLFEKCNETIKLSFKYLIDSMVHNTIDDFRVSVHIHNILCSFIEHNMNLKDHKAPASFKAVFTFIEENLHRELTIEELAGICALSKFHFVRKFKDLFGLSPYQYLVQQRVERSRYLLKNKSYSIKEIGIRVGFNSPSHFVSTFKKYCAMTPDEYRHFKF